jgi:hypothetical protein
MMIKNDLEKNDLFRQDLRLDGNTRGGHFGGYPWDPGGEI